jgi:putative ABC transport system permease protein
LLLVGAAVTLVVEPGRSMLWSWLWVAAIVAYAGDVARRRAPEGRRIMALTIASFSATAKITLGTLYGRNVFSLQDAHSLPIAGMMVGNLMTAMVLVARRLVDELREDNPPETRQTLRTRLRAALSPQVESTKATGLVFLPGAMTRLILAGVFPMQAVLVQAVVMFLVLASGATTTVVVALALAPRRFTADHRLLPLPRSAKAAS